MDILDWAMSLFESPPSEHAKQIVLHKGLVKAIQAGSAQLRDYLNKHKNEIDLNFSTDVYPGECNHARTIYYKRPLPWVVSAGNIEATQILLESGSQVDIESGLHINPDVVNNDEDRQTSLHIAMHKGYLPIIRLLLANGANPSIRDQTRRNALHHLMWFLSREYGKSGKYMTEYPKQTSDLGPDFQFIHEAMKELLNYKKVNIREYINQLSDKNEKSCLYGFIETCMLITLDWIHMPKSVWDDLDAIIKCFLEGGAKLVEKDAEDIVIGSVNCMWDNLAHRLVGHVSNLVGKPFPPEQGPIIRAWVDRLVNLGVSLNAKNRNGKTPSQLANAHDQAFFTQAFEEQRKKGPSGWPSTPNALFSLRGTTLLTK